MAMPLLLRRRRHRTLWRCLETKNGSSCIEMKRLRLLSKFATSSWRSDPQPRQGCFQRNISDPAAAKHRGQRCILLLRGFYSSTSKIDKEKFKETATSDPPVWTWVDHVLPSSLRPYARLARMDKPIGTMLLLWPCFWSTAVAAGPGSLPDPLLLGLFATGAVVMRGAGCTINDMWDRDLDKAVARTASRPLAAGEISTSQATAFLVAQLTAGLAVLLSLPHTWYCFQWGCLSLPLVALYPTTKRFFPYPQAILGLTFNWGAIMGWAAVYGSMDWSIIAPLYGAGVTWTVLYDTLYAHQDKEDDAKLNLQSTALTFGNDDESHRRILHGLAAATYGQWLLSGWNAELALLPFSIGTTIAYSHLVWQIKTADFSNPHNLADRFRSNSKTGAIIFCSLTAGTYLT